MKSCLKAGAILWMAGLLLSCCGCGAVPERTRPAVQGNVLLRVYVVRHAEAYRNVPHPANTPAAKLDSLTPRGLVQAAAAGAYLANKGIVAVIASPTGRTRRTADAIGEALDLAQHYSQDKAFASVAADEAFADGVARAVETVERLKDKYPGGAVAIVSHGDICAGLLGQTEDTPIAKRYQVHRVPTGSVSEIVITDVGWYLLTEGVVPQ